jgi:hypothetical protein
MKTRHRLCRAVVLFGLGILTASSSSGAVLFSQPFNEANSYYSSGGPGYPNYYDDFILPGGGTISKVDWSGISSDDLTAFTINFYSDNNGFPGTKLSSGAITGDAGQTASGTETIDNFSAPLPAAFTAAPGTEYFIQILGTASGAGGFYWETSGQGNGGTISQLGNFSPTDINVNLAFTLEGTPAETPEPNTLLLGLLGAAAFLVRRSSPTQTGV